MEGEISPRMRRPCTYLRRRSSFFVGKCSGGQVRPTWRRICSGFPESDARVTYRSLSSPSHLACTPSPSKRRKQVNGPANLATSPNVEVPAISRTTKGRSHCITDMYRLYLLA